MMDHILLGLSWIVYFIASTIAKLTTFLFGWMLQVASWNHFVDVDAVTMGWIQVRNLANMFFILILLVIAFATILRIESYNIKKLLPKLIIMAILINFSKMISGFIIDFSQVIMMTFVKSFNQNGANLADLLGIKEMWEFVKDKQDKGKIETATLGGVVVALIAVLITLVVVVVAIAVFLMRIIMLWIYIVLSPLAYLLSAFPQGQKYASQWWGDFTKHVISGPVLAFFLWLAFQTAKSSMDGLGLSQVNDFGISQGVFSRFLSGQVFQTYMITIGFLVGGLIITQQIGGVAASVAGKGMGAIQKGKGMALNGIKKGATTTAKVAGREVGLGLGGAALQRVTPKNSALNKAGQFASNWRTDIKDSRQKAKETKRLATLKKMGMREKSMSSLREVADTKPAKYMKTAAGAVAGAATIAAGAPAAIPIAAALYATVKGYSAHKKNKVDSEKSQLDDAKKTRNARIDQARKRFDANTGTYKNKRNFKIDNAKTIRDNELSNAKNMYNNGNIPKSAYDKRQFAIHKRYNDRKRDAENEYNNEKDVKDAGKILKNELKDAGSEFKKQVHSLGKEEERFDKIYSLDKSYGVKDGKTIDPKNQKKYEEKLGLINDKYDKYYKNNYHPNKVTMGATKRGIQDITQAKQKVGLLADDTRVEEFDKGTFYSASGQTASQKKFFDQLVANTNNSTKAIEGMVESLTNLQKRVKNGEKVSAKDLASIQSLKQGIAAYKKGGGAVGRLTGVINIVNNIQTGDGSDPKHTSSVEDFESKVV